MTPDRQIRFLSSLRFSLCITIHTRMDNYIINPRATGIYNEFNYKKILQYFVLNKFTLFRILISAVDFNVTFAQYL